MTASLPMYDTVSTGAAYDRFWTLIREAYARGPLKLDRVTDPHTTWDDPALVLSQTCGLPFRSQLQGRVTLVGTPDYGVRGCPPGYYKSYVVVRRNDPRRSIQDFRAARLARNDKRSQSGWAAIEAHLMEAAAGFSFVGQTVDTGAHLKSAKAVAASRADIAAIDAVTWTLIKRDRPDVAKTLRVLFSTRPTPGLPFISAKGTDPEPLFAAIARAIPRLTARDRARLLLKSVVRIPAQAYLSEPLPPSEP
jgi:ABC-type phosphate/phosphonate transport system substrate-binding protein